MEIKNNPEREAIRLTQLWQNLGPNTYPLDLNELIDGAFAAGSHSDSLSIKIKEFDGLEGCLVRTQGTNRWTILLNSRISNKRRQRFTLAHELGHFVCHRSLQDKFEDTDETMHDYHDEIEREANIFAAWLLMPANLIRAEFGDRGWNTKELSEMGNRFECSLQASALRYVALSEKPIAFVVSRDDMILWATKSKSAPYMKRYSFGDELAPESRANSAHASPVVHSEKIVVGHAWSDTRTATETRYYDQSESQFMYTCIEFD